VERRGFLRRAGVAIAALGIDPELLIWQPRQQVAVPSTFIGADWGYGRSHSVWMLAWRDSDELRLAYARTWNDVCRVVRNTNGEVISATRSSYIGDGAFARDLKFERVFVRNLRNL
jgi:hypothetical protein